MGAAATTLRNTWERPRDLIAPLLLGAPPEQQAILRSMKATPSTAQAFSFYQSMSSPCPPQTWYTGERRLQPRWELRPKCAGTTQAESHLGNKSCTKCQPCLPEPLLFPSCPPLSRSLHSLKAGEPADQKRRQWHPTPVLLPGKSHGQRSLVGCSPQGCWESDTTERLHFHFSLSCTGEASGNPLVFLPGESQGRGSLVGCCLWGCTGVGHD